MVTETKKELIDKYESLVTSYNMGEIEFNNWEESFIESIAPQLESNDGFLTELQIEKLEEIYEKYNR